MKKHTHPLDDLSRKIINMIPPGIKELSHDFEKNLKLLLQSSLKKLELVSRKEFDTQCRVLQKTREKLEKLESRLIAFSTSTVRKSKKK
ncbi:MAG: hypothetical protein ACD_44C00255G0002 [uncultured bacterium]|nr:MAG: hypothetical protein ACD_44C00255G0002 [uncultured bacterium]OGT24230.1 MAG: hypothetical protein A2W47_06650 [Gammaproteobacteria bacterium RIFCSPHIGHO2_12_38_15]OGT67537.1 MAG: hypothetical protein A3I12_06130 [Gammaproteobacteria bacterium RIFCSPLOWO2_02_FULL_38_11]